MTLDVSSAEWLVLGLLVLWALLLQAVTILTLRDRDRVRRRRTEMAELQLQHEATWALNSEVEGLASAAGVALSPSRANRTYREWWESHPILNAGPVAR
jgi:hypothetical protein